MKFFLFIVLFWCVVQAQYDNEVTVDIYNDIVPEAKTVFVEAKVEKKEKVEGNGSLEKTCYFEAKQKTHSHYGVHIPKATSLEKCMETCRAQSSCKSFDWDPANYNKCWFHKHPFPKFHRTSTHYTKVCCESNIQFI